MQITIKIVAVEVTERPPAAGKKQGFSQLEVTYRDDRGEVKSKKLMSFASPAVFNALKSASPGSQWRVDTEKNGEYRNWTAVTPLDDSGAGTPISPTSSKAAPATSSVGRSSYETPEERALRQRLIVRQSSVTAAITMLTHANKDKVTADQVFSLAENVYDWVYQKPDLFNQDNDIETLND